MYMYTVPRLSLFNQCVAVEFMKLMERAKRDKSDKVNMQASEKIMTV